MDTNIIKQGKLLFYTEKQSGSDWVEADVQLLKNSVIVYTIKGVVKQIIMTPQIAASHSTRANYDGLFVINTKIETAHSHGPMFCAKDSQEGDRWMQLINYTRLKNNIELVHNHPLTPCTNTIDDKNKDNVCPSVLRNVTVSCAGCKIRNINQGYRCEFCNFELCSGCQQVLDKIDRVLLYTSEYHPHPLLKLAKAKNSQWLSSDYNGSFKCNRCNTTQTGPIYHCVECGDYDECKRCGIEGAKKRVDPRDEMTMQLGVLAANNILTQDNNRFSLSGTNAPQAASMIANKHWDLSMIDDTPANAYFEVTFTKFNNKEGKVSVGIGNQIFVQNQLLGYQQNSFGYLSTGVAVQNVGTNRQRYPTYKAGDTIGVGILLDSYNQRRLYFTKNGQLLNYYLQRMHVGMDCFPGVSFTRGSEVEFEVRLTAPFKFDPNSLPNYRLDRTNRFEALPGEIIGICFAYAATQPSHAALYRTVSKRFAEVALGNTLWKRLYLIRWPRQSAKLNVKSWIKFYKRRRDSERKPLSTTKRSNKPQSGPRKMIEPAKSNYIENCDFEFECPLTWEKLKTTTKKDERYCNKCKKTVYEVADDRTLQNYVELGRCVTFIPKPGIHPRGPDMVPARMMGSAPPKPRPVPNPYQTATERLTIKVKK